MPCIPEDGDDEDRTVVCTLGKRSSKLLMGVTEHQAENLRVRVKDLRISYNFPIHVLQPLHFVVKTSICGAGRDLSDRNQCL